MIGKDGRHSRLAVAESVRVQRRMRNSDGAPRLHAIASRSRLRACTLPGHLYVLGLDLLDLLACGHLMLRRL